MPYTSFIAPYSGVKVDQNGIFGGEAHKLRLQYYNT